MEENVALDSKKQKKFAKSIKGIKTLLKKNEDKPHKPAVLAPKDGEPAAEKKKKKRKDRGLVYLSHIPHGFYEPEMTQYFKQFGLVTNVRVIRSPRTGRSKGFGFVEFKEPAVAEIVAETMNNYLMGKRLIKAVIVPPEKQRHHALRKRWTAVNNPTAERRRKMKKEYNSNKDEAGDLKKAKTLYKTLEKKKKKFAAVGLNIDFFTPVDIPEAILTNNQVKQESETKDQVKVEGAKKKKNKTKNTDAPEKLSKKEKKTEQVKVIDAQTKKELKKKQADSKLKQNEKEKKLKDSGVRLPENFIQIQPESGEESDSSVDFDSDEYEKMLENDSDDNASDGASEDEDGDASEDEVGDESEDVDEESGEEDIGPPLIPVKAKKGKKQVVAPQPQPKKAVKQVNIIKEKKKPHMQLQKKGQPQVQPKKSQAQPQMQKKSPNQAQIQKQVQTQSQIQKKTQPQGKQNKRQPQNQVPVNVDSVKAVKRKIPQPEVSPKKPKFEKQDKKQRNKQFKKKNKAH